MVFITETQCVYCAVRNGPLYIILFSIAFKLPRLNQVGSDWNLNAEVWVRSRVSPYLISGGQSDNGAGFSQSN